jgi:long-subunit fatty acid transport protein
MILSRKAAVRCLIPLALLSVYILIPRTAYALNGPQFIGFSAESTALAASGHVAVADTSAINTNPAAMSLIQGTRFDVTAGFIQAFLHHSDVFGNTNVAGQNNVYALGNLGVATRLSSVPGLTIGAGIFTQGGFGSDYRNLMTAFGTQDAASSFFRYLKFAIGLSYEATDKLSFGIAPSVDIPMSRYACFLERLCPLHRAYPLGSPDLTSEIAVPETAASVLWAATALPMWCFQ